MKKLFVLLVLTTTLCNAGCQKDNKEKDNFQNSPRTEVPDELIAPNGKFWTLGTISSINFWSPESSEYRNAGGIIVFFKFNKDGTYKFLLYVNVSTATTRDQTWTEVDGTVEVGETVLSDGKTYKTIQLHPVKGTDRILTNTRNATVAISQHDLQTRGNLAGKYACSRYTKDGRIYLDMLNLKDNFLSPFHEEN